jgi:hypothetical protein
MHGHLNVKSETYRGVDGFYVKIYIILTYSAFVGVSGLFVNART